MSLACLQLVAQGLKLAPQPTLKTYLSTHPCLTIICWYLVRLASVTHSKIAVSSTTSMSLPRILKAKKYLSDKKFIAIKNKYGHDRHQKGLESIPQIGQ